MSHFNELSEASAESLALLAEEAAEVIQVVGKILRHGLHSTNPTVDNGLTNAQLLERELGDFAAAVRILVGRRTVSESAVNSHARAKLMRVGKYLHHIKVVGVLPDGNPSLQ